MVGVGVVVIFPCIVLGRGDGVKGSCCCYLIAQERWKHGENEVKNVIRLRWDKVIICMRRMNEWMDTGFNEFIFIVVGVWVYLYCHGLMG